MTKVATQPQPRSVAEVDALIDKTKALKSSAEARLPELERQRRQALLDSDDAAVDKMEREIEVAKRDCERAMARVSVLDDERIDAIEREATAHADALAAKAQRVREAAAQMIRVDYPQLARAVANLIAKVTAAEEFIRIANRRNDGRAATVGSVNDAAGRFEPERHAVQIEKWWAFPSDWSYLGERLRSVDGSACPPKPPARTLGQNSDGSFNVEQPELRQREVPFRVAESRYADEIETLVMLPAASLDDAPLWNADQMEHARTDHLRLVDELLNDAAKGEKRGRTVANGSDCR